MLKELTQKVYNAKNQVLEEVARGVVTTLEYQILSAVAEGKTSFVIGDDFPEALFLLQTARFVKGPHIDDFKVSVEHTFTKENIKKVAAEAHPAVRRIFDDIRYFKSPITISWASGEPCGDLTLFWT